MKKEQQPADRRSFLKLAGASAVGGGAALAAAGTAQASQAELTAEANGDYRETDHVKRYYELAREY